MSVTSGLNDLAHDEFTRSRMLDDLQLAAELGKTLLERNKELETALKHQQNVVDDQAQEIEYLTKQTVALKEVNDSRLRIYEQLEVSIQDLERANHRLALDNSAEKKHVKSLNATIESLEIKCEDLQSTVDELRLQVDVLKRKVRRTSDIAPPQNPTKDIVTLRHVHRFNDETPTIGLLSPATHIDEINRVSTPVKISIPNLSSLDECDGTSTQTTPTITSQTLNDHSSRHDDDDIDNLEQTAQLLAQLRESRSLASRYERRIAELEEQLATMVQQNQSLENQLIQVHHKHDEFHMKSMHEELTTLEEVRQGQMCSRCLRTVNQNGSEVPDDDDTSMLDELMDTTHQTQSTTNIEHHTSFNMSVQDTNEESHIPRKSPNPYKQLVEKFEAMEGHRIPLTNENHQSMQGELNISGEFNMKDTDEESGHGSSLKMSGKSGPKPRKVPRTPTDFSETETNSSGFIEETSNKFTQTEGRGGSYLCTIADGEDCKFSIYDDASPLDSRFSGMPEYRGVFMEIFKVLKKASENKEEGETLPLLDERTPVKTAVPPLPKAPLVAPSNDHLPDFVDDDSQSVLSSTMSELSVTQVEGTKIVENIIQSQSQVIPDGVDSSKASNTITSEPMLTPLKRQPLEYISIEAKKRSSRRKSRHSEHRSDSPAVTHIIGVPKYSHSSRPNSGKKRRELKNVTCETEATNWNGNTVQFWATNRNNTASPTPSQSSGKGSLDFKLSPASHDLQQLKKLDLSYAEVLRNADTKKWEKMRHQRRK